MRVFIFSVVALFLSHGLATSPAWSGVVQQTQDSDLAEEIAVDPIFGGGDPLFDDDFEDDEGNRYPDPLEETNRVVLKFNQGLDRVLLGPIVRVFSFLTPTQVKFAMRRFFDNLNAPVVAINDAIQLEWKDAAVTIGGFVINSTVGVAGLFEPAKKIGLPRHKSDFGQTLAIARVPSGPYLVLPLAGPSTARDSVGTIVDLLMSPTTWFLPFAYVLYYSGESVVTLEEHHAGVSELERSSIDFYSVLQSAYYQNRIDEIWSRREHRRPDVDSGSVSSTHSPSMNFMTQSRNPSGLSVMTE